MSASSFDGPREAVDAALAEALDRIGRLKRSDGKSSGHRAPPRLLEAMRYAALSPGKRLRPVLVVAGGEAVGARAADVLAGACAIELIHAYSLVHDDLPMMDNDDLRRGRPTCHRAFDPATALLAGDALLTEAFGLLAGGKPLGGGRQIPAGRRARVMRELSRAAGAAGMAGGQYDDVQLANNPGPQISLRVLMSIHRRKTGRLIQAAPAVGAILGGGSRRQVRLLRKFGADLGLAFQLVDDALDGDGIARLESPDRARERAQHLTRRAVQHLLDFGSPAAMLRAIAESMASRLE